MLNMQSGQEVKLTKREGAREIEGGGGREQTKAQDLGGLLLQVYAHASNSFLCKKNIVYIRIQRLRYKKTSNKHQLGQQIRVTF